MSGYDSDPNDEVEDSFDSTDDYGDEEPADVYGDDYEPADVVDGVDEPTDVINDAGGEEDEVPVEEDAQAEDNEVGAEEDDDDVIGSSGSSNSYTPYTVTNSGTNTQGNDWDTREQPGGSAYHYSNTDGSYYYSNSDGSTYHDNGSGGSTYTAPDGNIYTK